MSIAAVKKTESGRNDLDISKQGVCNIYLFINHRTFWVRATVLTGEFQTPVQNISFNSTLPYNMEWNFLPRGEIFVFTQKMSYKLGNVCNKNTSNPKNKILHPNNIIIMYLFCI